MIRQQETPAILNLRVFIYVFQTEVSKSHQIQSLTEEKEGPVITLQAPMRGWKWDVTASVSASLMLVCLTQQLLRMELALMLLQSDINFQLLLINTPQLSAELSRRLPCLNIL